MRKPLKRRGRPSGRPRARSAGGFAAVPSGGDGKNPSYLLQNARILAVRERELILVRQKFNTSKQFIERVHRLTVRLSAVGNTREALAISAQSLVDDFAYEFAGACRGGVLIPPGMDGDLSSFSSQMRRFADAAAKEGEATRLLFDKEEGGPAEVRWIIGASMAGSGDDPPVVLMAGRTARTAAYYRPPEKEELQMFRDLAYEISQALTGVRYREELTSERNRLKEAAVQLRGLLVEAHAKEKEISDLHSRLSVTLEGLGEAVITLGARGEVLFANKVARTLLGPAAGFGGDPETLERGLFRDNLDLVRGWMKRAAAGELVHEEAALKDGAGGASMPVDVTVSRILDSLGQLWGFVQTVRDLREIKKLRNTLQQSDKLAAMGQMAAGIAHEINNPLMVILGYSEILAEEAPSGGPRAESLKAIAAQALRCKDLVRDMLDFSRSSATTDLGPMDVGAAVRQSMTLIGIRAKSAGVEVAHELEPGLPLIKGNNSQIQQVMVNLANNAIDAVPRGGRVSIRVQKSARKAGHVEVQVRDNGSGIPPEILGQIFEPFFTTKGIGKGTGLGLSLVSDIVRKHGGTVEVESQAGRGTTFFVFFPCLAPPSPAPEVRDPF